MTDIASSALYTLHCPLCSPTHLLVDGVSQSVGDLHHPGPLLEVAAQSDEGRPVGAAVYDAAVADGYSQLRHASDA